MKHCIKVSSLGLLLQSTHGLGIDVAQVTKHSKPRTPVGAGSHCRECKHATPRITVATVVHCTKHNTIR